MGPLSRPTVHRHRAKGGDDGERRYDRRRPEESVLYGVVQGELETSWPLPFALRYRLAYDAALTSAVLDLFVPMLVVTTAPKRRRSRPRS